MIAEAPEADARRMATRKRVTCGQLGPDLDSQLAAESVSTSVAHDRNSSCIETRTPLVDGQPESRHYRARYRNDDEQVSERIDIVEVTGQA
jgi:hypothetical protein